MPVYDHVLLFHGTLKIAQYVDYLKDVVLRDAEQEPDLGSGSRLRARWPASLQPLSLCCICVVVIQNQELKDELKVFTLAKY